MNARSNTMGPLLYPGLGSVHTNPGFEIDISSCPGSRKGIDDGFGKIE